MKKVEIRIKKDKNKYVLQIARTKDGKAFSYIVFCERLDKISFSDNVFTIK